MECDLCRERNLHFEKYLSSKWFEENKGNQVRAQGEVRIISVSVHPTEKDILRLKVGCSNPMCAFSMVLGIPIARILGMDSIGESIVERGR